MIPLEWLRTTARDATPPRPFASVTACRSPLFQSPKSRRPLSDEPSPQRSQKLAPVGAVVGVQDAGGRRRGAGPSWFVFFGGLPAQVSFGPHAKLPPPTI